MVFTKEEVDARRRKVIPMILRGMSREAIAKEFEITSRTVDSDVLAVKKQIAKRLNKVGKNERISEYEETARLRNVQLWKIILGKESKVFEILRAVHLLQREDIIKMRRDQIVGLFPKDDLTLTFNQFNLNNADKIKIEYAELETDDEIIDAEVIEEE